MSGEDAPRPSRIGQIISEKYKLVRLLGEGGMGAVYEAQHVVIQRRFAIKFVHQELARRADVMTRFRREAQAAGSLENENIAAITDFGTAANGAPYMVMEYLTGQDLSVLLAANGPLPVPRAAHIVIQACRGLDAAHARGIIHRDLKPENLFIGKRGDGGDLVKVLDFGIAKLRDGDGGASTQTGSTIGTPYYMPPEQARGAKTIDHRADVYALGVILYELLTQEKPHPGDSYNAIMFHILTAAPTPLATLRAGLPDGLVAAVERAMAPNVDERFDSVMELANALAPFVGRAITPHTPAPEAPLVMSRRGGAPTMPTPVSLSDVRAAELPPDTRSDTVDAGALVSAGDHAEIDPPPEGAIPTSNPGLFVGLAVAALVAVGVVVTIAMRSHGDRASLAAQPTVSAGVSAPVSADTRAAAPVDTPTVVPVDAATASATAQPGTTGGAGAPSATTKPASGKRPADAGTASKSHTDLYAP